MGVTAAVPGVTIQEVVRVREVKKWIAQNANTGVEAIGSLGRE